MNYKSIETLIENGEGTEIEFKENLPKDDSICKSICALANTKGGVIIIGVSNDSDIKGIENDFDQLQIKISQLNIRVSPTPTIYIEKVTISQTNKYIATINVQEPTENSYHTYSGAVYIRVGSTNQRLEGQTQLDFLRNKQLITFDESYTKGVTQSHLNEEKILKYLKLRGMDNYLSDHSLEDFLLNTKLATRNGTYKIKNAAVLLFADTPTNHFPQTEINLVKFSGTEPVNITAQRTIKQDVISSITAVEDFILRYIEKKIDIIPGQLQHQETYEYPLEVIRELIVNAVTHRDYFSNDNIQISIFDNRIEFINPGGLPNGLTDDLFGLISVRRNPIIYRILKELRYIEGLGSGIPRVKSLMRERELPEPEFKYTDRFFRVVLKNNNSTS